MNTNQLPFLAIVGLRGVGKSTLLNALVNAHSHSVGRVKSYTTRPRRALESEYTHVSEDELVTLLHDGRVQYIDEAYGYSYAMDAAHIRDLRSQNIVPAKEIHKDNLALLESTYGPILSVLVVSDQQEVPTEIDGSQGEEQDLIQNYDIVFRNCFGLPVESNTREFITTISALLSTAWRLRQDISSETECRRGYDKVAPDFRDSKRPTTNNFHELSIPFWQNHLSTVVTAGGRTLEIAPGNGWLRNSLQWPDVRYSGVDLSTEMLKANPESHCCVEALARAMPFPTNHFDDVVISLADPCLTPGTLCEIRRVLRPGGILAFTTPHSVWATALRPAEQRQVTSFALRDEVVVVPSYMYSDDELVDMLTRCGFEGVQIRSVTGGALKGQISPAITAAARNASVPVQDLPVLTCATSEKP